MGMTVNTNMAANSAYRNLSNTQNTLSKSMEKLSSGLRINRAADDAAGLVTAEGLRSQVGGLQVAQRNAQDGISVIQTAEGGLTESHSILQRLRDLAVQAGSDSNNPESRAAIAKEATALVSELDRIGNSTNFNGTKLLDGSANLSFQIGADGETSSRIGVNLKSANLSGVADALNVGTKGAQIGVADATLVAGAMNFSITAADGSTSTITTASLGAAGDFATVQDVADALNADTTFRGALSATVDANDNLVVTSRTGGTVFGGSTANTHGAANANVGTSALAAGGLDFFSAGGAANAIKSIDTQISGISSARADLGATQNRMESALTTLSVSQENLSAAESRIRDTDMAAEMVKYSAANIMSQAGTAMLAQANQSTQGVLQLLG
ncbi:flagellin [Zafaria cholistanensis]|uniref:Flagellin n=1 Tax=Zafaria cholistanensis TaxID=1682741 RepID=A0A5A7NL51_9MICC|nr:flagellin [Zafaria cholistanensis]GER21635.1 flagellin [Zafaria cholistanensis]